MRLSTELAKNILNMNPSGLVDQSIADRQFEVIVEAFNHLFNGNSHIYIADEVGLGKTYIALGITSLLRHFSDHPQSFNDTIIVPKKNLQNKWQKEIRQFISNNYLLNDNRVKSVIGMPIGKVGSGQVKDKFRLDPFQKAVYLTYRISSFSLAIHDNFDWKAEFQNFPEWSQLETEFSANWSDSFNRRLYALLMNINTPNIDCLIIDEVHNFKHGISGNVSQRNEVMSRFVGNILDLDNDIYELFPFLKLKVKTIACKVIFLSATPIDRGIYQLKNQLDIFLPNHKYRDIQIDDMDEIIKSELSDFLIRGVMNITLNNKEYSRNMYRHEHRNGNVERSEHAEPLRLSDNKMALITGLVQYKTMKELSAKNNPSFEIGLLAGFESFKPKPKNQEQEFDNSVQTEQKDAEDAGIIQLLAESYQKEFGEALPHLKQDSLIKELFELMKKGEKALVFTRRIASVNEIESKLSALYANYLFKKVEAFEKKNSSARLQVLTKSFKEQAQRKEIESIIQLVSQRININKFNNLFDPPKNCQSNSEIQHLLTLLYDEPTEDEYWINLKETLDKYQKLIQAHIGRKNRVDSILVDICYHLLQAALDHLLNDANPDITLENEAQNNENESDSSFFFEGFFKGKGKTFRKATYDNPWYEINILLINNAYELFHFNHELIKVSNTDYENKKESYRFKNEQDKYEAALEEGKYEQTDLLNEILNVSTFITQLLLKSCHEEFNEWITGHRNHKKEIFLEEIHTLEEIIKGIFRNGSGLLPAYLAWSTGDFTNQLVKLIETDFLFVLKEVKTVIKDFHRIISTNFPDSAQIKYTLYNQLPALGVSGQHKVNVSKAAAQFRMPGFPYILVATDILKEGEDLHTYCTNVYHYGIAWNPSDMEQRTGRIDRIGSKCYYGLIAHQKETIPFKQKLQVFFPYLADTLEVNQVSRVFNGMNQFIDTFYDFTDTKSAENSVAVDELVKTIPQQITSKLESKYDIQHFNTWEGRIRSLEIQPIFGMSMDDLKIKLEEFNQYIIDKQVDKEEEFSIVETDILRIKGLIYNETKGRQCPYQINIVNGESAGEFQYEILSSITTRNNLNIGAMKDIRENYSSNTIVEFNSIIYLRSLIPISQPKENLLNELESLVFKADDLEEKYAKEDKTYLDF